jgi:hypothetical protein
VFISPTFCEQLFYAAIFYLNFGFILFWHKKIGRNPAPIAINEKYFCGDRLNHPMRPVYLKKNLY